MADAPKSGGGPAPPTPQRRRRSIFGTLRAALPDGTPERRAPERRAPERRGPAKRNFAPQTLATAALRAVSPAARKEPATAEVARTWSRLWADISHEGDIRPGDEMATLACERWRRKERGERHGFRRKLKNFRSSHADWNRLTAGIRAGVPSPLRGAVWYACSGAAVKRQEAGVSYADYVQQGLELRTEATTVIEVDLPRTGIGANKIGVLRNILLAFAARNPSIGYCQSMNFIAKTLLLYNEEERAFWILCSLLEDVLPAGYYTPTMNGLRCDLRLLDSLIAQYLPNLSSHLRQRGIDLAPITMNWFLCLFVNTLPAEASHRVLDCLLHEGPKVLFRAALGILHMREAELLKADAVVDAYVILRAPLSSGPKEEGQSPDEGSGSDLFGSMYGLWLLGLSTDTLSKLREEHLAAIRAEDQAHDARREAYRVAQQDSAPQRAEHSGSSGDAAARRGGVAGAGALDSRGAGAGEAVAQAPRPAPGDLRAHSFAVIEQLPLQPDHRLGFAERPPDESPQAVAHWIARISGDEEHADRKAMLRADDQAVDRSDRGADAIEMEGDTWEDDDRCVELEALGFSWLCCQRRATVPMPMPHETSPGASKASTRV